MRTGVSPSEYKDLTLAEVEAFIAEVNDEPTDDEADQMVTDFADRLREEGRS